MSLRVRDKQATVDRLAIDAADKAAADKKEQERRAIRKSELKAHLDRVRLYHERTSHLPPQHKRTSAPVMTFRPSDEEILAELNSELIAEIAGPIAPEVAEAEADKAHMDRCRATAKEFTESEPCYFKCQHNFQIMADFITSRHLPPDSVDSYREAFVKTRAQQKPRPQPTQEDKARDYFEKVVHHAEGKDWTEHDLDRLSADRYKQVMRIPQRAPLGSLLRPKVWQPQPEQPESKPKSVLPQ
jgi:hypothetical protein